MFGIGGFELFLIILFAFLVFGPDKLPEIAKTLGMAINKFKKAKDEMDGVIKEEIFDPSADEPFKNPAKALDKAHGIAKEKFKRAENEETFAERKARYEREREELRKRAEIDAQKQSEIDANRAKMKQEAADKAAELSASQDTEAQAASGSAATTAAAPKLTADELYGNVPLDKSHVRPNPSQSEATPAQAAGAQEGGCQ